MLDSTLSNWIDAHCHLADPRYSDEDLENVLVRSKAANVSKWIQGGVSPSDWKRQKVIRALYGPSIVTSFGLHPWWVSKQQSKKEIEVALDHLASNIYDAQAIGELGLDFSDHFLDASSLERQYLAFEAQLEIAKCSKKPIVIHAVRAHEQIITLLKNKGPFSSGGIVHSFSADLKTAKEYLDLNLLISIGGSITRRGYRSVKEALNYIPLEKIVIETDSPDQTPFLPDVLSNELNEPKNLIGIAKVIAGLLHLDPGKILYSSTMNLKQIFGISL